MACVDLPHLAPSSLTAVIGLSNNDVISLRCLRCVRGVGRKLRFSWDVSRLPGVDIEIIVVDVGVMVDGGIPWTSVVIGAVIVVGREEALRPLRLPRLLHARQTDRRALTEREVRLKHTRTRNMQNFHSNIIIIIITKEKDLSDTVTSETLQGH